jgi:hypothetical protein
VLGEAAARELQWYYTPTKMLGRWIEHTRQALESAERKQEKGGLARIFQCKGYSPEEAMALLYTRNGFLGCDPATVRSEFGGGELSRMEDCLSAHYGKRWGLDDADVERWFRPLREKLECTGAGNRLVAECFPTSKSIREAEEKVFRVVHRGFQDSSEFLLFRWRHKLL